MISCSDSFLCQSSLIEAIFPLQVGAKWERFLSSKLCYKSKKKKVARFLVEILPLVSWYLVKARICHLFIDILDKSWHTLHVMSRDLISIRCTIGHNFGSVLANYVIMTKKLFVHISYSR